MFSVLYMCVRVDTDICCVLIVFLYMLIPELSDLLKDLLPGHSTMTKWKCQKFNCKVKGLGTFIDL